MWLRLAVVAVALLASFGAQARDFDISGNEYIGSIIEALNAGVYLSSCRKAENNGVETCIYGIHNDQGLTIEINGDTGKIKTVTILCIKESCKVNNIGNLIRMLMKISPMMSKYIAGWDDMESWEQLVDKVKDKGVTILRRNADLAVAVYPRGPSRVYIALPEVQ